jgi:hypothetical protein
MGEGGGRKAEGGRRPPHPGPLPIRPTNAERGDGSVHFQEPARLGARQPELFYLPKGFFDLKTAF